MLVAVIRGIAVFLAGPLLAFLILSIGCDGSDPALGVACGHNTVISLVACTLVIWFVLIMASTVRSAMKNKL